MPDSRSVQENIGIVRALSNETAAFLHSLPADVWRDPDRFASGCQNWKVGDVIAHLVDHANRTTLSIERALRGSVAPPPGYRPLTPEEADQQLVELRTAYDEDLFPEFNASCLRLNRLLVGLEAEQYDLEAWHPGGIRSAARLIEYRALELSIHEWDAQYAFDRQASLSLSAIPFLMGWVEQWLRAAFQGADDLASSVRLRFDIDSSESYDLTIENSSFSLGHSAFDDADVTLALSASDYILALTGRLPVRRLARRGRIQVDGNAELAYQLTDWFGAVHAITML
ncbi:MAG: maleylpyruvate isomerase family mycothiol-dependent enzyme [SAR202 cluster bacterium]|jgi:uncharacterized protein (TIGR03083 family)|nr:maleylpyruvate isomerase family mycothiol-dependent enzyme [SAR202 cluster bacterium]MDP6714409.1 maleylpyruvate isomerase family mycothiol-dependent enzyme [SAR202 cluster bacterium]